MSGGSVGTLRIPVFTGSDKIPVQQIFRMPVAVRTGYEHIILAPEFYDSGVHTRTVRQVVR